MPELPEVEVVRRGLADWVAGRTVASVDVAHPRAVRRHTGGGTDFAGRLAGRTLTGASRRGKYLWLPLDGHEDAVLAHLGMSGQLLVRQPGTPDETHLRVRIAFADDGPELRFVDQRTFGGLAVVDLVDGVPGPASRTSPATPSTRSSTTSPGPRACAGAGPASSGRCWTRPWPAASATSTPTRRCGARGCTAPGPPRACRDRKVAAVLARRGP